MADRLLSLFDPSPFASKSRVLPLILHVSGQMSNILPLSSLCIWFFEYLVVQKWSWRSDRHQWSLTSSDKLPLNVYLVDPTSLWGRSKSWSQLSLANWLLLPNFLATYFEDWPVTQELLAESWTVLIFVANSVESSRSELRWEQIFWGILSLEFPGIQETDDKS